LPESSALTRLDRGGPATASALAKLEQISPQSMGATLGALEARGLVERRPDPADGRKSLLTVTAAGRGLLAAAAGAAQVVELEERRTGDEPAIAEPGEQGDAAGDRDQASSRK